MLKDICKNTKINMLLKDIIVYIIIFPNKLYGYFLIE